MFIAKRKFKELKLENIHISKMINFYLGVKEAEEKRLGRSIEFFNLAVEKAPHWASSYNNRAQAYRLSGNMKGIIGR